MLYLTQTTFFSSLPQISQNPLLKFGVKTPWNVNLKDYKTIKYSYKLFLQHLLRAFYVLDILSTVLSSLLSRWRNSERGNKLAKAAWLINTREGIQLLASCYSFSLLSWPPCWWIRCRLVPQAEKTDMYLSTIVWWELSQRGVHCGTRPQKRKWLTLSWGSEKCSQRRCRFKLSLEEHWEDELQSTEKSAWALESRRLEFEFWF